MRKFLFAVLISITLLGISNTFTYYPASAQTDPTIERVSVASDGTQGDTESTSSSISSDGRFVAFISEANTLVSGDTNGNGRDVFVHDRQTGETSRVSVASDGTEGNRPSGEWASPPSISSDGRFVAFSSSASNLVTGDTNGFGDIFVHDRQTGQTTRESVKSGGVQGNGSSSKPSISSDGRFVVFASSASNLVTGDTNGFDDIFVHDRQTGQTTLVSVASDGTKGNKKSSYPAISSDGRFVVFASSASNLVTGDTNGFDDIFVHDRQTGQTTRVSITSDGTQGNNLSSTPSISGDGFFVAFVSTASNFVTGDTNGFVDVFVHDRQTGQTTLVSVASDGTKGNEKSSYPSISSDGRFVVFFAWADNLVSGDTNGAIDVFLHDRETGQTTLVSLASDGTQGNDASLNPFISGDGRFVAFDSWADNLVAGDTNGLGDVFAAPVSFTTTTPSVTPSLTTTPSVTPSPTTTPTDSPPNAVPLLNYYTTDRPTLTWGAATWAVGYEIQVDNTPAFNTVLEFTASVGSEQLSVETGELADGTYYWRVRSQRANGTWGAWNGVESFVVNAG